MYFGFSATTSNNMKLVCVCVLFSPWAGYGKTKHTASKSEKLFILSNQPKECQSNGNLECERRTDESAKMKHTNPTLYEKRNKRAMHYEKQLSYLTSILANHERCFSICLVSFGFFQRRHFFVQSSVIMIRSVFLINQYQMRTRNFLSSVSNFQSVVFFSTRWLSIAFCKIIVICSVICNGA